MNTTTFPTKDVRIYSDLIVDEIRTLRKSKVNPVSGMKAFGRLKEIYENLELRCVCMGWDEKEFGKEVACRVIDNL